VGTDADAELSSRSRRVRPMTPEDLPGVAALFEHVARSGSREASPGLASYLARTLFDCPWSDPEIPPLVYESGSGSITGFLGAHARRFRFAGRPIRLACAGPLVTEPDGSKRLAGALLVLRMIRSGPQDMTITDGANAASRRLTETAGGESAYLGALGWIRLLRPASFANNHVFGRRRSRRPARIGALLRPLAASADALIGTKQGLRPLPPDATADELTPGTLLDNLEAVTRSLQLYPDYDEAYLCWAFTEMERVTSRGRLVTSLVRDGRGRFLGWYVYYLQPGGECWVIQIAAVRRKVGLVIDHLFHHAYVGGGTAVRGRVEPGLLEPLSERGGIFRYAGTSILHSRDPALLATAVSADSLLTYLDGEWWMGPHLPLA
jgi:hypothetical protein